MNIILARPAGVRLHGRLSSNVRPHTERMLRVRTLPRRSPLLDFSVFLLALAGGVASVVAFVLVDDRGAASGISLLCLLPSLYMLWKAGRQRREAHRCPECQGELPSALENSTEDGEPILHHCKKCEILWFAGSTSS